MTDVYSYARHSSQVIGLAGSRLVLSHPELAAYLFRHAGEELGHEQWAASDLRDLGVSDAELSRLEPSSPCLRMIALEYFCATHANPVGLFGWMFVLESLGGKVGGSIATAIDGALQLEGKATRFLRGHAEADAHHSEDLLAVIAAHVRPDDDERAFLRMAAQSLDLYTAILDAAAGVPLAA
jgi:pyrroloquinoline quinone (PQQ) biosynthesis protein C